jgi:hypothetical protein
LRYLRVRGVNEYVGSTGQNGCRNTQGERGSGTNPGVADSLDFRVIRGCAVPVPGEITRWGCDERVVQLETDLVVITGQEVDVEMDEGLKDSELQALGGVDDGNAARIPAPAHSLGAESGERPAEKGFAGDPPEDHVRAGETVKRS